MIRERPCIPRQGGQLPAFLLQAANGVYPNPQKIERV
jgi:hypothetical protein